MARFDISGSASRAMFDSNKLNRDIATESIRKEIQPSIANTQAEQIRPELDGKIMAEKNQSDPLQLAALKTVDFEARKDRLGNPEVYRLPRGDMGGNFEVAGINDRYHPEAFKRISSLPAQERAEAAAQYIKEYTSPLVSKLPQQIQPFAQDLAFNRGMVGATKYIQQGLNELGVRVAVDGKLGPQTLQAIQGVQPAALMRATSNAQLNDEYVKAKNDSNRLPLLRGLENRIRKRLALFGTV